MGSDEEMTRKPMASDHSALAAQLLAEREYEHPSGWWPLKVEIEEYLLTKDAEIERLKRAMDLRHKDAMKLVDLHTKLESENERLKAQLAASEEKRKVVPQLVDALWAMIRHCQSTGVTHGHGWSGTAWDEGNDLALRAQVYGAINAAGHAKALESP